ncbi:MAG TPA: lipopolysaccharide transport periplasmic protein LptA [Thauera sp.]|nr:lipopolysaccharide transport periplasmic protein LptA [Thauera sp.]HHW63086.1 lipopolysaccharide transport periplasmic protein LptA [Rhodocyclaceae bacterium]
MKRPLLTALFSTAIALAGASQHAQAEKADRDQPVNIEADRLTVDDRNKVHIFEGNVILTQGTLVIRGDKLVVTQDAAGFQNGVATASGNRLATFRQRRDGSTEYVEGEAERIEYDSRSEKAKLFNRAKVTSGGDQVIGHYIEYDAITENYLATNAPGSKPGTAPSRVRAVIQPKSDGGQ